MGKDTPRFMRQIERVQEENDYSFSRFCQFKSIFSFSLWSSPCCHLFFQVDGTTGADPEYFCGGGGGGAGAL